MSDIVLSAGVRSNLLQLQQTSDLITQTQTRLATGKRVNSALDNAINFFTAQGLDNRANDLSSLLDSMSNAINTIQAANNGITAITKLVQSEQALASQAQQTTDTTVRATLASQFDALTTQIGQLASDSGFNGVNLLGGNNLTVTLDETGSSSTTVNGVDYTNATTGLGIDSAVSAHQLMGAELRHLRFVSPSDDSAYLAAVRIADSQLRTCRSCRSARISRRRQSTRCRPVLSDLTLADSNEEGANLLALQTRQQLSTTALSLASQADQNVLRLFQ